MVTLQLFAYPVSDETLPDKTDACTSSPVQMQTRLWSWLISAGNSEPSGTFHAHERCEALETVRRPTVGPVPAVFRRGHVHDSSAVASRCMDFRYFGLSRACAMDDLGFPVISSTAY